MTAVLEIKDVHKAFGGNQVLSGLSFEVQAGEVVGLLGPNGCGKSTVLNAITGYCAIDQGEIRAQGRPLTRLAPHEIARMNIRRTFQLPSMPARMSVLEVAMSASTQRHSLLDTLLNSAATRRVEAETRARAEQLLDELLLAKVARLPAGSLSGGQKKLLSIACALMAQPTLLLLDEPMAGVHPNLRTELIGRLKHINAQGISLVIVEHDMHFIAQTCGRCVVLDRGRTVADCVPSELSTHEGVVEAFLGRRKSALSFARESTQAAV